MDPDHTRKSHKVSLDSRERAIVPMTIAMANLYCRSDIKNIEGQPFESIKVVGRLVDHQMQPNKHLLLINDDTGVMRVTQTVLQNTQRPAALRDAAPNRYLSLIVTPKLTGDNHDELVFYCNRVEQCDNMDALTCHLCELMFRHAQRVHGFTM